MSALNDHNVVDPRIVNYRLRPVPLLTVGWSTYVQSRRNSKNLSVKRGYAFKPPLIGATPGISHSFHISFTIFCTYSISSSVRCANLPCLLRNSRTGRRGLLRASWV